MAPPCPCTTSECIICNSKSGNDPVVVVSSLGETVQTFNLRAAPRKNHSSCYRPAITAAADHRMRVNGRLRLVAPLRILLLNGTNATTHLAPFLCYYVHLYNKTAATRAASSGLIHIMEAPIIMTRTQHQQVPPLRAC